MHRLRESRQPVSFESARFTRGRIQLNYTVTRMDDRFVVTCPYCGEDVEIYLEPDVRGTLVQDCEVCCNPWRLRIVYDQRDRWVEVRRADGSE